MKEISLNPTPSSQKNRYASNDPLAGKSLSDHIDTWPRDPDLASTNTFVEMELNPGAAPTPIVAAPSVQVLQKRYEDEMAAWRAYEKKVRDWQLEVTAILSTYKGAQAEKNAIIEELEKAQQVIKQQQRELEMLRGQTFPPTAEA